MLGFSSLMVGFAVVAGLGIAFNITVATLVGCVGFATALVAAYLTT
jgi:hypothetical protein